MDRAEVKNRTRTRSLSRRKSSRRRTIIKRGQRPPNANDFDAFQVPKNLNITQEQMIERKHMDIRRWLCISRPQLKSSCGMSSLVSCWNYLYSKIGTGNLPPLSQEEALVIVGINPPFDNVEFGSFTGNSTLIKWFRKINKHFGVEGKAQIFYKPCGSNKTAISSEQALNGLIEGLKSTDSAFIYHCYNHYFSPIGFEIMPQNTYEAYSGSIQGQNELWIAIGETARSFPSMHFKRWADIDMDLCLQFPKFYDIRRPEKGIQEKTDPVYTKGKKCGSNLHCLIKFNKL